MNDSRLLTPSEVAARLGVSINTLGNWARQGKIASRRTIGGHRRYVEAEVARIERALADGRQAGADLPGEAA